MRLQHYHQKIFQAPGTKITHKYRRIYEITFQTNAVIQSRIIIINRNILQTKFDSADPATNK